MTNEKKKTGSVAAETPSTIGSQEHCITAVNGKQVLGKEAVAVIKEKYPGFDHSLWSKCKRPDIYGVRLVSGAEKLVRPRRKDNRKKDKRWSFRVTKTVHSRLQTAMQRKGITSMQTLLEMITLKWLEENEDV